MRVTESGGTWDVKTVKMTAKCADCCVVTVHDTEGKQIAEHLGYVPKFMPGQHGDYVDLEIDVDTGRILNWRKPGELADKIALFLSGKGEDE